MSTSKLIEAGFVGCVQDAIVAVGETEKAMRAEAAREARQAGIRGGFKSLRVLPCTAGLIASVRAGSSHWTTHDGVACTHDERATIVYGLGDEA